MNSAFKQTQEDSVKTGTVKASVHPVEDHITREAAVESEQIIIDHRVILNPQMMMLCNYCRSIPGITVKKETWNRYLKSDRICAPEPD